MSSSLTDIGKHEWDRLLKILLLRAEIAHSSVEMGSDSDLALLSR